MTSLRILFVEDLPTDQELAERNLRAGGLELTSRRVDTEDEFLAALQDFHPEIIISDYSMPMFDGMQALRLAQESGREIPFIILTGARNEEIAVTCMKAGAWDYVIKERMSRLPFAVSEALAKHHTRQQKERAESQLKNLYAQNQALLAQTQQAHQDLMLAYDETIAGWSHALDLRDKETEGHSERVTELTLQLACRLGVGEQQLTPMRRGALLHDIGKLGVPDHILLKPGPLTSSEWELMRKHPVFAYEMLSPIAYLKPALAIPYCHHEHWDGNGYPRGLRGPQIPLEARIFSVVDVWDALTSDRPYRKAWTREQALDEIKAQSDRMFEPAIVSAFLEVAASG
ncbi:MAG: HD domain-containing phosphohydrolase [Chloroflexota bacterium]